MLTALTVEYKSAPIVFTAVELLDVLQQALPGVAAPAGGGGTQTNPWRLSTPQAWFGCAKKMSKDRDAWLAIGGRLIRVKGEDLYASDHGVFTPPTPSLGHSGGLATAVVTAPTDRFGPEKGPSYPEIYHKLAADADLSSTVKTREAAKQTRELLKGAQSMTVLNSAALPVMVAAMFISEVKRNHTAFHTGLMLLDFIESGVPYKGSVAYTWDKILWHPQILEMEAELQRTTPTFREDTVEKAKYEKFKDDKVETDALGRSISRDVRGGDHPMAQSESVAQSAQGLIGDIKSTMTVVRQKEATIVIRWMCYIFNSLGFRAEVGDTRMTNKNFKEPDMGSFQVARARSTLDHVDDGGRAKPGTLGSAAQKKIPTEQAFVSAAKTELMTSVVGLFFQARCTDFDLAFDR